MKGTYRWTIKREIRALADCWPRFPSLSFLFLYWPAKNKYLKEQRIEGWPIK
jgi:hypothetical protein